MTQWSSFVGMDRPLYRWSHSSASIRMAESLLAGKRRGNLTKIRPLIRFLRAIMEGFQSLKTKIRYSAEQGIWISITGILSTEQGILAALRSNPGTAKETISADLAAPSF